MDAGGDMATTGPPNAMSETSADDEWRLRDGEAASLNRDAILADIKRTLENTNHSPVTYLESKYSDDLAK